MAVKWKTGDTWHKLAFKYLGDETRYREILEQNPGYSVIKSPLPGQEVSIPSRINLEVQVSDRADAYYFPWVNLVDYYKRLEDYTGLSLFLYKDLNGLTLK